MVTQSSLSSIATTIDQSNQDLPALSTVSSIDDSMQLSSLPSYTGFDDSDSNLKYLLFFLIIYYLALELSISAQFALLFRDFLSVINPIDRDVWEKSRLPNRIFTVIRVWMSTCL